MQRESDSLSEENTINYEKNLTAFIEDVRERFDRYSADDGIVFVDALIADNPEFWVHCDLVNAPKRSVEKASDMNLLVDTIAAGLTCAEEPEGDPDMAHYDSKSEIKLGHLFAKELIPFLK